MFVVGGLNAIMSVIPAGAQTTVMAILALAASYFHLQAGQSTTGSN